MLKGFQKQPVLCVCVGQYRCWLGLPAKPPGARRLGQVECTSIQFFLFKNIEGCEQGSAYRQRRPSAKLLKRG